MFGRVLQALLVLAAVAQLAAAMGGSQTAPLEPPDLGQLKNAPRPSVFPSTRYFSTEDDIGHLRALQVCASQMEKKCDQRRHTCSLPHTSLALLV